MKWKISEVSRPHCLCEFLVHLSIYITDIEENGKRLGREKGRIQPVKKVGRQKCRVAFIVISWSLSGFTVSRLAGTALPSRCWHTLHAYPGFLGRMRVYSYHTGRMLGLFLAAPEGWGGLPKPQANWEGEEERCPSTMHKHTVMKHSACKECMGPCKHHPHY